MTTGYPARASSGWRYAAAILCLPLLILFSTRSNLYETSTLDPFVYLGYISDYGDLVGRYGRTYYSIRLAHILPNKWAAYLLGDTLGYYVIRYILLALTVGSIYRIARHYTTEYPAWLISIFFSSHVWLLSEVLWDHYSGTVLVCALVSIALLLPSRHEITSHALAGVAAALAANGNPVGLFIVLAFGPAWLIERRGQPWKRVAFCLGAAVAGFALCYSMLILSMVILYPGASWQFDQTTLDMLSYLFSGGGANWFNNLRQIFVDLSLYETLIFPFFLALSIAAVLANWRAGPDERRKAIAAASFVVLMVLFFAVFHFVLRWGVLSLHYYLCYFMPAAVLATASLIGKRRFSRGRTAIAVVALLLLATHFALWRELAALPFAFELITLSFCSLGWLLVTAALNKAQGVTAIFVLLIAIFSSDAFFNGQRFKRLYGADPVNDIEWDVRNGALYMSRFIAQEVPGGAPVGFWYSARDYQLNAVQSTHLWGYSRVAGTAAGDAPMPAVDVAAREKLKKSKYIALLGTEDEIQAGVAALATAGFATSQAAHGQFQGHNWPGYRILLLRKEDR